MTGTQSIRTGPRRAAFTLLETVMSVLIVGVLMIAALETIGAAARDSLLQQEQGRATALAEQLLSEVIQCRYTDPNTDSGETRATWDDISDYDGLNENPPTSRNGTPLAGYSGWRRSGQVQFADPANPAVTAGSDLGLKRVIVTVVSPLGKTTTLTGLRSSSSKYEQPPKARTTYSSWVDVAVQVSGDTGVTSVAGANLLNRVP